MRFGKKSSFLRMLKLTDRQFKHLKSNIESFYTEQKIPKKDRFGNIRTDSEGNTVYRTINPSHGKLKEVQKIINGQILSKVKFPNELHGSIKGRSNITNAKSHQGNKYFLLTDLKSYFPSIQFNIVYEQLGNLPNISFSPFIRSALTRFTTYKQCVPQGAPTSSTIANIVFLPWDKKLIKICEKNNLTYTRYVDDLTFSSKKFIAQNIIDDLLNVIRESPFYFHPRKTKTNIGITEATGICIKNNGLDAPDNKKRELNSLDSATNRATGLANYINQVKNA